MATPVTEYESSWSSTTSPKTSSSLSVQAGDVLAVVASGSLNLTCSDSQGLSWTLRQSIVVTNYEPLWLWTATVAATGSLTVTVTRSSGSSNYGMNVTVWRGVTVGASSKTNATGAPSLGITTTAASGHRSWWLVLTQTAAEEAQLMDWLTSVARPRVLLRSGPERESYATRADKPSRLVAVTTVEPGPVGKNTTARTIRFDWTTQGV